VSWGRFVHLSPYGSVLLARNRCSQALAASGAPTPDNVCAGFGTHPLAETVCTLATDSAWLKCTFHGLICSRLTINILIFVKSTFKHSCQLMSRTKNFRNIELLFSREFSLAIKKSLC
jgi:hypothetical protein